MPISSTPRRRARLRRASTPGGLSRWTGRATRPPHRPARHSGSTPAPAASFALLSAPDGETLASARPTFAWTASSDSGSGLAGYDVSIDGGPPTRVTGGATTFTRPATSRRPAHLAGERRRSRRQQDWTAAQRLPHRHAAPAGRARHHDQPDPDRRARQLRRRREQRTRRVDRAPRMGPRRRRQLRTQHRPGRDHVTNLRCDRDHRRQAAPHRRRRAQRHHRRHAQRHPTPAARTARRVD